MTKPEMAFRIISGLEPYTEELYLKFMGTQPPDRSVEDAALDLKLKSAFDHRLMCMNLIKQEACKYLADAILKHTHY